jgi:hypothetical protein
VTRSSSPVCSRNLVALTRAALISLALTSLSCEGEADNAPPPSSPEQVVELTEDFLVRALSALKAYLEDDVKVLEIHVTGGAFSVHVQAKQDLDPPGSSTIFAGSLMQLDYVETTRGGGQPPIGKIIGPRRIEAHGTGEVKDNLYPFSEVDLRAMARAFRVAVLTIDPLDGMVEKLIVRRNLPFGARVRGRIYVHSPRMSGSVDVNENGTPLKR